jgi:hypothetical protein
VCQRPFDLTFSTSRRDATRSPLISVRQTGSLAVGFGQVLGAPF